MSVDKVNIEQKLASFNERWNPKIVGELNGQYVKLVKFLGEFVWHHHDEEDELFLVVKGRFRMEFRDREVGVEGRVYRGPAECRAPACGRRGGARALVRARFHAKHGQHPQRADGRGVGQDLMLGGHTS
jgi:hypothetical protein